MNYGTLTGPKSVKGSVRSWVNYDPIDVEGVVLDAQAYIYGRVRVREMKASVPITFTQGSKTAPLPTDFLDPIKLVDADGIAVAPIDEAELLGRRSTSAMPPTEYSIFDELLQLTAPADATTAGTLLYFKRPANLSASNSSNFLTTRYSNLLRVACLMHAADQIQDDTEYARWKARADEIISAMSVETDLVARGRDYTASVR
jgi:hypothetical protein